MFVLGEERCKERINLADLGLENLGSVRRAELNMHSPNLMRDRGDVRIALVLYCIRGGDLS